MANRIRIRGDAEVRRALRALGVKVRRKICVAAIDAAMEPVLSRALSEAPRDTSNLAENISKVTKGESRGRIRSDVGVRKVRYAGFEEYGAEKNHHPADPFMQRTYDAEASSAGSDAQRRIAGGIEKEARSLA